MGMLQDLETLVRTGRRRMAKKHQKNRRPSLLRKGRLLASGKIFALALFYFELGFVCPQWEVFLFYTLDMSPLLDLYGFDFWFYMHLLGFLEEAILDLLSHIDQQCLQWTPDFTPLIWCELGSGQTTVEMGIHRWRVLLSRFVYWFHLTFLGFQCIFLVTKY